MINYSDVYCLTHYEYGLPYTGEYNGMRYRIARNPLERVFGKKVEGEASIEVIIWRGPFCFDTTQEEKITKEFPFTDEGLKEAVDWLNTEYDNKKDIWELGKISNLHV